jgi:hypothetical protein
MLDRQSAARERGAALGGWRGGPKVDQRLGTDAARRAADTFAHRLAPIVRPMREGGLSLRAIADELQAKGVRTARGGSAWTPTAVRNALARLPAV